MPGFRQCGALPSFRLGVVGILQPIGLTLLVGLANRLLRRLDRGQVFVKRLRSIQKGVKLIEGRISRQPALRALSVALDQHL